MMDREDSENKSILLSRQMSCDFGSENEVYIRRRSIVVKEQLQSAFNKMLVLFMTGSVSEGFKMAGSDIDQMIIDRNICVLEPHQCIPPDCEGMDVLLMHKAENSRPGYVKLKFIQGGNLTFNRMLSNAIVKIGEDKFVSSDIYREELVRLSQHSGMKVQSHGPTVSNEAADVPVSFDVAIALPCVSWPSEASGWISRPRLHGWPDQTLIRSIVESGCHVVPVGDKCSVDTALQWRVSFATAERRLVHSLNHTQFQVYGLLKILLKNLKESLIREVGKEEGILSSYFLKTIIFHAAENTPKNFWKESNTFTCFWFCFNILILWVKSGYCPQYFIPTNNLFKRYIHGATQHKLLNLLTRVHKMKWNCFSVGTFYQPPSISQRLFGRQSQIDLMYSQEPHQTEARNDMELVSCLLKYTTQNVQDMAGLIQALQLLCSSKSELDEFLIYFNVVEVLFRLGNSRLSTIDVATSTNTTASNKAEYGRLRKIRHFLTPKAAFGTDVLYLATFHYLTGNYRKSVEMCQQFVPCVPDHCNPSTYMQNFCGRGHSLLYKMQMVNISMIYFGRNDRTLCLPHLHKELSKHPDHCIRIPPLSYAAFLAFLSYYALGDARGHETALRRLIQFKYDKSMGGGKYWIVHTLLGICYQTLGNFPMAIRAYLDSLQVGTLWNPAMERIQALIA